ncbi:hypothetical protein [Alicyclobacillus acidocaldarius]|uniref:Uncharacterized protein n=1 Tax=Alicyclobacillus acidocaldarius (strain Tc-4-1) TaxID=1048834 RepID=F8IEC6_ALIAT|nr:hypothetical protein [Alicyclobacillus acidocaldarius]AEJ45164.1 hypothetical protein TC41_3285 [Alicyclobacillus acidocaldarius subsp. acidocaldarius Tc-4-1]
MNEERTDLQHWATDPTTSERRLTRRERRILMEKARKRRKRRRRRRMRRVRAWRAIRSLRFWARALAALAVALMLVFWARFAYVYDIPDYAAAYLPPRVTAYITVKSWWFGPPVIDVGAYEPDLDSLTVSNPYDVLLQNMGFYATVLSHPRIVWARSS